MTKEETLLFEFIDDLLRYEWDLLGLNGHGDEYASYVPQIFNLVIDNAPAEQIADRLHVLEIGTMGVAGDFEKCKQLARIIVQKKESLRNGLSGP